MSRPSAVCIGACCQIARVRISVKPKIWQETLPTSLGKLKFDFDLLGVRCEIGTPLLAGAAGTILSSNAWLAVSRSRVHD